MKDIQSLEKKRQKAEKARNEAWDKRSEAKKAYEKSQDEFSEAYYRWNEADDAYLDVLLGKKETTNV